MWSLIRFHIFFWMLVAGVPFYNETSFCGLIFLDALVLFFYIFFFMKVGFSIKKRCLSFHSLLTYLYMLIQPTCIDRRFLIDLFFLKAVFN